MVLAHRLCSCDELTPVDDIFGRSPAPDGGSISIRHTPSLGSAHSFAFFTRLISPLGTPVASDTGSSSHSTFGTGIPRFAAYRPRRLRSPRSDKHQQ